MFKINSNVIKQNPRSKSLRTTIPSEIVNILNLTDEDKLAWIVTIENNNTIIILQKEEK